MEVLRYLERPRIYRERDDQFFKYSEIEFRDRFRLTKVSVSWLIELIGDNLQKFSNKRTTLSVLEQFLITLRFYATGMYELNEFYIFNQNYCKVECFHSSDLF